jgi:DNA-binding NarL/FixJ family response regulator
LSLDSHINTKSIVRIVIVEDFVAFRRLICSILEKRQDLQVICQVSDGLEAVQKSEELKPDMILLDIGIPNLNGLDAARQIRKITPESKIIFVSHESSPDLVREALCTGARGYVSKARLRTDLLLAVEEVLNGRQFVSSGLIAGGPD